MLEWKSRNMKYLFQRIWEYQAVTYRCELLILFISFMTKILQEKDLQQIHCSVCKFLVATVQKALSQNIKFAEYRELKLRQGIALCAAHVQQKIWVVCQCHLAYKLCQLTSLSKSKFIHSCSQLGHHLENPKP